MLKIVHINFSDSSGGAARAMRRLHEGLRNLGIDSKIYCFQSSIHSAEVIRYDPPKSLLKKVRFYFRKIGLKKQLGKYHRPGGYEIFSDDRSPYREDILEQLPYADIYHLHWVSGFVDLPSFFKKIKKPIIWTLHDMNPFTGGCHYSSGCTNFTVNCGMCPQLNSDSEYDLSHQIFNRKLDYSLKKDFYLVSNSNWIKKLALKSKIFRDVKIDKISLGVDTDIYIPRDQESIRRAFNLPLDKKIILFGAMDSSNKRKGFSELSKALKILSEMEPKIFLLTFGSGDPIIKSGIHGLNLGHIESDFILSLVYNAADVFVISSLEEAFGQTALEAMSCGIPVAGFDSGGISDMVENGITGYLADTGNVTGLAKAIGKILDLPEKEYSKMANNCRDKVLSGFTLSHQAEKYIKVYSQLIN